jgi:hypothetical protein
MGTAVLLASAKKLEHVIPVTGQPAARLTGPAIDTLDAGRTRSGTVACMFTGDREQHRADDPEVSDGIAENA